MQQIHLVGQNKTRYDQTYLGCFSIDWRTNAPRITTVSHGYTSRDLVNRVDDLYMIPTWSNNTGVDIRKVNDTLWTFTFGTNGYAGGYKGILINGGPEMEQMYNEWVDNHQLYQTKD